MSLINNFKNNIKSIYNNLTGRVKTYSLGSGYTPPRASVSDYISSDYGSGAKFSGGMSASRLMVTHDHFQMRQSAREAMYDSTEARALVESYMDTVVETGLTLKPTPDYDILKISPEQAEEWAEQVSSRFHLWAKSRKSHRPEINNFYQNQRLYELFQQRDNDIFVRLYYNKSPENINPLQIDFVDPNQIRGYAYTTTYYNTLHDSDGIVRDAGGKEIGYKVWYYNNLTGDYSEKIIPAKGEKSGRYFMLHGFNPEFAGQGRGYSRIGHALHEFQKLTDFKLATIQKAINQASFVMAVENDEKDPSNPLAGRVAGPVRDYGVNIQDSQGTSSDDPVINYTSMPEATIDRPGSTGIFNLRRGDKIKNMQDTSPSAQYETFTKAFLASLAASTGSSEEIIMKKFNNSYSASRATLILFWRVAQIWRDEMAADFLDPTYEMWLSEEIAAGRVRAPGWNDPRLRAAWLSCEWAGAVMPSIDPSKTARADRAYLEMSAMTLDDVARNLNGSSGKANRMKNKRQFSELPIAPWNNVPAPVEGNESNNKKDDEETEEEDE